MRHQDPERERDLRKLIGAGSGELKHYIELAHILYYSGRSEECLSVLNEAFDLDLSEVQRGLLFNEHAQMLTMMTTRTEEALSFAEQAIAILARQPPTGETRVAETAAEGLVAQTIWDSNRPEAIRVASHAISTVRNAVETEDDPENLCMLCGTASRLYLLMGQIDEAAVWIRRAVAQPVAEDDMIGPLHDFGYILKQSGRNEEAEKILNQVRQYMLRSGRENPHFYHHLGLVELSLGRPRDAKVHFEKALRTVQDDSLLRSNRDYIKTLYLEIAGVSYELSDHLAEAQAYRDVLTLLPPVDPAYWRVRLSLARSEMQLRRFEQARELLDDILKGAPSDEIRGAARSDILHVRYGIALRDYESRSLASSLKECEALLRNASGDEPLHANVLLLLGHIHVALRRYGQAGKFYSDLINSSGAPETLRNTAKESIKRLPPETRRPV